MRFVRSFATSMSLLGLATVGSACLDRPISVAEPNTKASIQITSRRAAVDKIDLLLMIDNSASMGDKQEILAEAVPDLVTSLVLPSCVDDAGKPTGDRANPSAEPGNECASGRPEFAPQVDIHIGIVSSSMGGFGSGECNDPNKPGERDGARLVARGPGGAPIEGIGSAKFLAWLPDVARNKDKPRLPGAPPVASLEVLKKSAADLVKGVGDQGCGLEAQLESVYHFLNAPAPYTSVALVDDNRARLEGLDNDLLAQRAQFLRPDSLVAVVMLTDEDDSQVDPLSLSRLGHFWGRQYGLYSDGKRTTSRGTSTCAASPSADTCRSCIDPLADKNDPECTKDGGFYSLAEDQLNVRFHKMKKRFGVDPQYPLERYRDGLSKARVPNRDGTGDCQNPLFAAALPAGGSGPDDRALCDLPAGKRRPEEVFFAVLGGVPGDLLHFDPADPKKSALNEADWDKIVGKDADHYARDEGVDPRMVQSTGPRAGRPGATATAGDNAVGGEPRDWDTKGIDLQYACTFPLRTERRCDTVGACDCNNASGTNPPLCGPSGKSQILAKAYPTPRELRVARMMGKQGVAGSLCPLSLDPTANGAPNPYYGYRPAMSTILERLKGAITQECLPQSLPRDSAGKVACIALHSLPEAGATCASAGLQQAPPEVVDAFLARKHESRDTSYDGKTFCRSEQLAVKAGETCKESKDRGFCYVENEGDLRPLSSCSQALVFSRAGEPAKGVTTDLLCIRQSGGL